MRTFTTGHERRHDVASPAVTPLSCCSSASSRCWKLDIAESTPGRTEKLVLKKTPLK